jgi:hypothetical protein
MKYRVPHIPIWIVAGALLLYAGIVIGLTSRSALSLNQQGALTREEPYSFFTAITPSDTTQFGLLGNNKPIDGVFLSATAGQTLVVNDQNGTQTTFTFGAAGTYVLPISPSKFPATGAGTATGIVALFK